MTDIIRQSFKIDLNVLNIFGLYISGNNSTFLIMRAYMLYFSLLVVGTTLTITNVILGKISGMQMNLMVVFIVETMSLWFKVLPFIRNGERIRKCIHFFGQGQFAPKDKQEKKIIDECVGICHRNCVVYLYGVLITEILWNVPVFFAKERTFPIYLWFPYDPISSDLIYYVTLFYVTSVFVYDGLLGTVTDPLIGGLAYHATAQLKILKYNLQHLDKYAADATEINNEYVTIKYQIVYKHLKRCIDHHSSILSFVAEYEKCFSGCVFWQLAASLLSLCFCCIGLTLVTVPSVEAMIYFGSAVIISFQILFYCHYGTLLYEENNGLINSVYMGPWYRYDVKIRKILLTIMERSKRPITFTAGDVVEVTLETFVTVLKSSYSLVAVLNNYD